MSYCRSFDRRHEVYMYHDVDGTIHCCFCRLGWKRCPTCGDLSPRRKADWVKSVSFKTRSEAIKHLEKHKKAGQKFPARAITRLKHEIRTIGDEVEGLDHSTLTGEGSEG